jgi:NADPH:quinone reductase-like Zn-dependent oxidoreductase
VDKVLDTENLNETVQNEKMLSVFGENSVDVIMDHLGAQFLDTHLKILKRQGRIVFINAVTGERGPLDYDLLIGKRIHLIGSILRGRSLQEKASIRLSIENGALPILNDSLFRAIVDSEIPINDFALAFRRLTDRKNQGKIVLKVTDF